jgi:hypothetical protein
MKKSKAALIAAYRRGITMSHSAQMRALEAHTCMSQELGT